MTIDKLSYRRTYLYLEEVLDFLSKKADCDTIKDPVFLTSFSVFFLLNKPHFNFEAHGNNSVQTFYANHYLRESLKLDSLPKPEKVLQYISSGDFEKSIKKVLSFLPIEKSDSFSIQPKVNSAKQIPLLPDPPEILVYFIRELVAMVKATSGSAYICKKNSPSELIYQEIEENGFAIEHEFLSNSALSDIRHITLEIAEYEKKAGSAYIYGKSGNNQRIYNLLAKHRIFEDLISNPYVTTLCDRVFDRPTLHEKFGLNSLTAHIIPPGAEAIPMHIDSVCPEPVPPWMIRFIAILPLENFTKDNGATSFVPGSHKYLRRPRPEDLTGDIDEKITECSAGSLVMFDGATWHRSSDNKSDKPRPGLMLSFGASYFMELCGEEEHLTIIPSNTIEEFSPKVRQMIGYKRAIKKGAMDISEKIRNIPISSAKY